MKRPVTTSTRIYVGAAVVVVLLAALVVTLVHDRHAEASRAPETSAGPDAQLRWYVTATQHLPIGAAELRQHFTPAFIQAVGGPEAFGASLAQDGPLTLVSSRTTGQSRSVSAVTSTVDPAGTTTKYLTALSVNTAGLIDELHSAVLLPSPRSWSAVDRRLRALAPDLSFATDRIGRDGTCRLVHGVQASTPRPLASAFKLYVLGALAKDVADHHARWGQRLAIRNAWKSYPSGTLQHRPAGTRLTLRDFADQMISNSDNTAADHLMHFVGRAAVERQLHMFGSAHASLDEPLPTTRELFTLKGVHYPRLARHYLGASPAERARILRRADRVPRSELDAWAEPRDVSSLEWFGSPTDICRAYSGLLRQDERPRLRAVGRALSINDGSLLLNSADYPTTWYKGGSELGVLTENYLVKAADGTVIVTSVMLSDPHQDFDDTIYPQVAAVIRGSLALADAG